MALCRGFRGVNALRASAHGCLIIIFLLLPYVSSLAFRTFYCECFEDDCYLRVDLAIACSHGDGAHTGKYGSIRRLSSFVIGCYTFTIPATLSALLWRAREPITSSRNTPSRWASREWYR